MILSQCDAGAAILLELDANFTLNEEYMSTGQKDGLYKLLTGFDSVQLWGTLNRHQIQALKLFHLVKLTIKYKPGEATKCNISYESHLSRDFFWQKGSGFGNSPSGMSRLNVCVFLSDQTRALLSVCQTSAFLLLKCNYKDINNTTKLCCLKVLSFAKTNSFGRAEANLFDRIWRMIFTPRCHMSEQLN